jgi:high affinity sulfate transporter 1
VNQQPTKDSSAGLRQKIFRLAPGLEALSHYKPAWLGSDIAAGLSVAAVALPIGVAYADLVGVPAVYGIYSAIFPLLAYALFGSSRQLIVGPDAATCLMVAASLGALAGGDADRYLSLMVAVTLVTGALLVIAGVFRLGFIANFLSQPILTGYLTGTALIIMVGQLPKLLGVPLDARGFFPQIAQLASRLGQTHPPTLMLGGAMLLVLIALKKLAPSLPSALIVAAAGGIAVVLLNLQDLGVAVIGKVPSGLPASHFALFDAPTGAALLRDAAGIVLLSFTSGMLTVKSFARKNHYDVDANQELIAFGASNIASGLGQGFPVTGTGSRTAVNDSMGGKSQLVGIIAAAAMLMILLFFTAPLAFVPTTVLAAVILVSAYGLFDLAALRELWTMSHRELALCLITSLGVLVFGMLPGILIAIALSLLWMLAVGSRPTEEVLGEVAELKGFFSFAHHPEAKEVPGLLLYRFNSSLVFFNADTFANGLREKIDAAATPVEWVVVDTSPFNVLDATAVGKIDELRTELSDRGIVLNFAGVRRDLTRFFEAEWTKKRFAGTESFNFPTIDAAVTAFRKRRSAPSEEDAGAIKTTSPASRRNGKGE